MASKTQVKIIHTLKTALAISEDDYRFLVLFKGYGVKSSKDLKFDQADELINDLERKAIAAGVWQRRRPARKAKSRKLADDPQSRKIRALWLDLHQAGKVRDPSEAALASYVKRMTGVSALQWLDGKQASQVIEALKQWLER